MFTRLSPNTAYFWQVTPADPTPGDASPIFSFITRGRTNTTLQILSTGSSSTDALLIALIVVILFALWVQVVFFRRRGTSD